MTDRDLYEELGVDRDADAAAIERAYRKKAQRAHPDKGGSPEEFHAIQVAYQVLSDEEKRKRYDETGEADDKSRHEQIAAILFNLMAKFVDNADLEHDDAIAGMKRIVAGQMANSRNEIEKMRLSIGRRERALKRMKKKTDGTNLFELSLKANIRAIERAIATLEADIELGAATLKILDEYQYQIDLVIPDLSSTAAGGARFQFRGTFG